MGVRLELCVCVLVCENSGSGFFVSVAWFDGCPLSFFFFLLLFVGAIASYTHSQRLSLFHFKHE